MNSDKQKEINKLILEADKNINDSVRPTDTVPTGKEQLKEAAELIRQHEENTNSNPTVRRK